MAKRMKFLMIGGFLGAGKTTTISRLAKMYQAQGLNVGIVTNDQAAGLVDTELLKSQGHHVGEVAGACFCCNFNDLTKTVEELGADQEPDVILAEPVGSCTDLVATVAQPLMKLFDGRFDVAPYTVILKPSHGRRILSSEGQRGFSPKAEYIFHKQLEEADLLIINRIDELEASEVDALESLLAKKCPGIPILRVSAKTGEGLEKLQELIDAPGDHCQRILDIDYDVYAEGEAELGWLNSNVTFRAEKPFDLDQLLTALTMGIQQKLVKDETEVAHLKVIGLADDAYGVVNLVSSSSQSTLSLPSHCKTKEANLVINARVAVDPETLRSLVEATVKGLEDEFAGEATIRSMQSFRPGRPVPTHRFAAP